MNQTYGMSLKNGGMSERFFIARNNKRWGKRYGFVRFKGVKDVTRLERKPDSLVVRGLKMHVNTPKHGRERVTLEDYIDKKYCKNILININLFSP